MTELEYVKVTNTEALETAYDALSKVIVIDGIDLDKNKIGKIIDDLRPMMHDANSAIDISD